MDDTAWDVHDPIESVGTILHAEAEADVKGAVVTAIVAVLDRQGAAATDAAWYGDQNWPDVRRFAANALANPTR